MAQMPKLLNENCIEGFLNTFDNVLTDCDGVLWRGDDIIGRSNEALGMLRALGKKIFYITNNSSKTLEDYVKKCESMNFVADKLSILMLLKNKLLEIIAALDAKADKAIFKYHILSIFAVKHKIFTIILNKKRFNVLKKELGHHVNAVSLITSQPV
ncbi:uncharacterized protein LOC134788048 [Penaeus indicus]|uniref:uncharacterized protein LOC134788048 n=1 Tax=Penaeus indicus TaxID=29960 RepID=UPI00300C7612